uniref:DNA-directed RNA polymerase n=1 Tax=Lepocinclis steinii TaxID=459226 RepID=A0A3G3LLK6_9EUGL|nr:RNA polymerase beta'' subunit [Lepocinclis steinii]AYQ93595.1 RNA polymerase beta'' subunit [Lepocinclis steinii]
MKKLICNKTFDKKQITKLIEWFIYNYGTIRTNNLTNRLKSIGFKHATKAGLSLGPEDLKIPSIKKQLIKNTVKLLKDQKKYYEEGKITKQNLLQKEIDTWNLTNNTLKNEIIKNFRQTNLLNPVYMMIFSGARGNLAQIKQLIGMRGLMSDSKGDIINLPIKSSLKEGLKSKEYFISCYGARKGIIDTALKTANSGYLTRKLIYVSQNMIIKQQDCKTKKGTLINLTIKNKTDYIKLKTKLTGTIVAENITDFKTRKKIICKSQDICPYIAKKLICNETYIYVRSILTCNINIGLCQLCYGWDFATNKLVRIGEAVGIIAAQSIGEPGTQLTMRTFHTGGIFTSKTNKVISSPHEGKIIYDYKEGGKKIRNKFNENIFITLKEKDIFIKKSKTKMSKIKLPAQSIIFLKPEKIVFTKQIIAEITEWNKSKQDKKEISEIKTYNSGQTKFQNNKKARKKLLIINGRIIDAKNLLKEILTYKTKFRNIMFKSEMIKISSKKTREKNKKLSKINFFTCKSFRDKVKTIITKKSCKVTKLAKEQNKLMLTKHESFKKIRDNKGVKEIGKLNVNRVKGVIIQKKRTNIKIIPSIPYIIPYGSNLKVLNNELIEKGRTIFRTQYKKERTKDIIEGLPKIEEILEAKRTRDSIKIRGSLHDKLEKIFKIYNEKHNYEIATRKAIAQIQNILVKQIQKVYTSQDVNIAEKHIAVIVKKITSKVIIRDKGDSNLMEGELIEISKIEKINKSLKYKTIYEPILIGITKTSLVTEGFISAACFQETVRILTKSAIRAKIDWLTGLKENIILGNLIPSGTGRQLLK